MGGGCGDMAGEVIEVDPVEVGAMRGLSLGAGCYWMLAAGIWQARLAKLRLLK